MKIEENGGPLKFKLNNEIILEKGFEQCDYQHNDVRHNIYNYINNQEYSNDLAENGYRHYFKVFVNTTKNGDLSGYNLKNTFKSLEAAKNKIKEIQKDIFAYVIYEVYQKDKKIYNIIESTPTKNGLIYLMPKYLKNTYDEWRKFNNIVIGLKTGKLAPIGNNLHFSIEQYEQLANEAIELLLFKKDMFEGWDQTGYWENIDGMYKVKINGESIFYK